MIIAKLTAVDRGGHEHTRVPLSAGRRKTGGHKHTRVPLSPGRRKGLFQQEHHAYVLMY